MTGWDFSHGTSNTLVTFVTEDKVIYRNLVGSAIEVEPTTNYYGCTFVVWYDSVELSKWEKRSRYLDNFAFECLDQLVLPDSVPWATANAKICRVNRSRVYTTVEYEIDVLDESGEHVDWRWTECLPLEYYDSLKKSKKNKQKVKVNVFLHPNDTLQCILPRIDRESL